MEGLVILLVLFLLWCILVPIVALTAASEAKRRAAAAEDEVQRLATQFEALQRKLQRQRSEPQFVSTPPPAAVAEPADLREEISHLPEELMWPGETPSPAVPAPTPVSSPVAPPAPPPVPSIPQLPPPPPRQPLNLEQFMGVKLFAWLGGIAFFFGVIFFLKYAFERNLIPPAARIALGYATGLGLLSGAWMLHRRGRHVPLSHALCATSVLVLYGVTYTAHHVYHFAWFNAFSTFVIMALITAAAFLVAVRLNALAVAGLGMVGGYLNPVLVSRGHDELGILTIYLALLAGGLIAVSRFHNWRPLATAAVVGTVLLLCGWFARHFTPEGYGHGIRVLWFMGALVLLEALFLTAAWLEERWNGDSPHPDGAAVVMLLLGWGFAFVFLGFPAVASRLEWIHGWLMVQSALTFALVWLRPRLQLAIPAAAAAVFLHLALWIGAFLNSGNLLPALGVFLVLGTAFVLVPPLLARHAPLTAQQADAHRQWPWAAVAPVLLGSLCMLELDQPAPVLWLLAMAFNLLAILQAARARSVAPVLGAMAAALLLAVIWMFKGPSGEEGVLPQLGTAVGFALFFAAAAAWLSRQVADAPMQRALAGQVQIMAGLLPFGLLLLAVLNLPTQNPSLVFAAALVAAVVLLGKAVATRGAVEVSIAALGLFAVHGLWHLCEFSRDAPWTPLGWYAGVYLLLLVFPFVFRRRLAEHPAPWVAAAVAGAGWFLLVRNGVTRAFPAMHDKMGLLPCAFAVPSLAALWLAIRSAGDADELRRTKLAWFGGIALLFITLVFPIQFDRQWLTVSWACEGAALLWLFRRVPHPGLQTVGLGLITTAFCRLALNPAILMDYPRAGMPILNWHLYTYGVAATAAFLGAIWHTDPKGRLAFLKPKAVLFSMCGVLLFLLLNIEITDYFAPAENARLTLAEGHNLARETTYSIAWGLFALGLLIIGIWRGARPARYAAIGLLAVTLAKLFLHDLATLKSIFRIGALLGVAVIAFAASFLYQQFFNRSKSP